MHKRRQRFTFTHIRIFLLTITIFVQKPKEKPLVYLLIPSGRSQEENDQI